GVGVQNFGLALGDFQRLLHGLRQAGAAFLVVDQAVDHHLNRVLVVFVELWELIKRVHHAVYAGAGKTGAHVLLGDVLKSTFFVHGSGREDHQAGASGQGGDLLHSVLRSLARNRRAALRTMRHTTASKQQTQVVIDFGYGRHRRTRVAAG